MRITSLNHYKPGLTAMGVKESLARKVVFGLLERIQRGTLILEVQDEIYHFGEARQNSALSARIVVHDPRAWFSVLQGGTVAAGEAYMHGYWDTPDLVALVSLTSWFQSK